MGERSIRLVLSALFSIGAAPAFAQGDFVKNNLTQLIKKVGVHVSAGVHQPLDKDVTKGTTLGASVGAAPGPTGGWKYPVGLAFVSADLRGPTGEQFGTLRARAMLAGIGYSWYHGKMITSLALQGGVSFNRTELVAGAPLAFSSTDAVRVASSRTSFVARPHFRVEYLLTEKVSVRTQVQYIYMQPNIAVHMSSGRASGKWNAQSAGVSIGLGYYPFRK
jgi:hypothetical protein